MNSRTREFVIAVFRPVYWVLRWLVIVLDRVLFGWLYLIWQIKGDAAFADDIRTNLYFLFPAGQFVKERWYRLLPFDYVAVRVNYQNVCFSFALGRGELNVLISSRAYPRERFELRTVVAALDSTDADTSQRLERTLSEVGETLRPRLDALEKAYSASQYPEFREKLAEAKKSLRVFTKQVEWTLNRKLYH